MYKKKKQKQKIIIIIVTIVLVILLPISLKLNRETSIIENIFKDGATIVNKIFMYPFTALNKSDYDQSESYTIQKNVNESLEQEIEELKSQLKLNSTLTEYTPINATILSRNKSYWFNTLTIDKGKKHGIKKDMAVITSSGLIGKIAKVSNLSSEIKLITSDDVNYKVSVSIKTSGRETYGILNGYDKETNLIKISGIDRSINVEKGAKVTTSGLGGVFPGGIFIGEVDSIKNDKYDLSKTIYIKTSQDFNNIHYVTVLGEKQWFHLLYWYYHLY